MGEITRPSYQVRELAAEISFLENQAETYGFTIERDERYAEAYVPGGKIPVSGVAASAKV